jgi:hypothetical protein
MRVTNLNTTWGGMRGRQAPQLVMVQPRPTLTTVLVINTCRLVGRLVGWSPSSPASPAAPRTEASAQDARLRAHLGGIVLARRNYTGDPALLGQLGAEAGVIARDEGHVPPWVLTIQDGREFNELEGLPPALAGADLASACAGALLLAETANGIARLEKDANWKRVTDEGFAPFYPG